MTPNPHGQPNRPGEPPMPKIMAAELLLRMSNEHLVGLMRDMKRARVELGAERVVCVITGFEDDPRELVQIPEARAFCRRLVDLGFISFLDVLSCLDPHPNPLIADLIRAGLGAGEVWLIAEGRWRIGLPVTRALLLELGGVVARANEVADAALAQAEGK